MSTELLYNISDFTRVKDEGFIFNLEQTVLDIIQSISNQVGAPEYIRTPQFSKQKIIFGYPDNLDEKFEKINIFYKKIVPAKGWNTYRTVNVKFKNQIICDKS